MVFRINDFTGKNIALNKVVTLSSTLPFWNKDKQLAVDGNAYRDFYNSGSCVSTNASRKPWIKLDLVQQYLVQKIEITTVGKAVMDRIKCDS